MTSSHPVFLKLGGSLITDKDVPFTARPEIIERLANEIAAASQQDPQLKLIIGHGSGSFGHTAARQYGTRDGVYTQEQWQGFAAVWKEVRALNEIVLQALLRAGLPVIAFPPSAAVMTSDGQVAAWDLRPLEAALSAGLIPLVNGDVIFDQRRGGTILSTEDLFFHLAQVLHPRRILLAGLEAGVWADFPACHHLVPVVSSENYAENRNQIGHSASVDVTGGMRQKVESMLSLAHQLPEFEALIFSGKEPGALQQVLAGGKAGTTIRQTT